MIDAIIRELDALAPPDCWWSVRVTSKGRIVALVQRRREPGSEVLDTAEVRWTRAQLRNRNHRDVSREITEALRRLEGA